jgi:hypothetical protein
MRIWLGIGVLTLGAAVGAQVKTDQPSLGAVAKAGKEEKAARAGKADATEQEPAKKYTNEDLVRRPRAWYRSYSTASLTPGPGGRGNDEAYWRRRARDIRQRLQAASDRLNLVKARLENVKGEGLDVSLANGRSSPMQSERQRLKAQVLDLEGQVQFYEQQLKDLEDEGRRAGALPGWFR